MATFAERVMICSLDLSLTLESTMASDLNPPFTPPTAVTWRQSTAEVLSALRTAVQRAIGFSTGVGRKSRDVQKRFGVGFQLSWEIYCVVNEGNVINCAPNVPLPAGMKRLCSMLRRKGIAEEEVGAIETAYDEFMKHVTETAGDRGTFNAMMGRLIGGETAAQIELVHREAAFEAQRYILGVEQGIHLLTHIIHPSFLDVQKIDSVRLVKRCKLVRLNYNLPFKVDVSYGSTVERAIVGRALDQEAAAKYNVPIMPAFCSDPDIPLRTREYDMERIVEWGTDEIGVRGSVDFAIGDVRMNIPIDRLLPNLFGVEFRTAIGIAARRIVFDCLMHRPTYGAVDFQTSRYARVFTIPDSSVSMETTRFPRLPSYEQIEFMGSGATAAHLAGVPDYVDMLKFACKEMKWRLEEFDVYRLTIDYPFMDTLIVRSFRFSEELQAKVGMRASAETPPAS